MSPFDSVFMNDLIVTLLLIMLYFDLSFAKTKGIKRNHYLGLYNVHNSV